MEQQTSSSVLLVRPAAFAFNPETAASNAFAAAAQDEELAARALAEFEALADRLSERGVEVLVLDDTPQPPTPDAVFPNNWVSFHADGTIVTYPMAAPTRRLERRVDALRELLASAGFEVRRHIDLSPHEQEGRFLEGTGSLILDRPRRQAFASLGPRTHTEAVADFAEQLGYSAFTFDAFDRSGRPIYHTNVLLSLGREFAVLCADTVPAEQRAALTQALEASGRTIIRIDYEQLRHFACNLIELRATDGQPLIALSSAAFRSLRADQVAELERCGELVDVAIPTIERVGGGSVRCMIADIHLPRSR